MPRLSFCWMAIQVAFFYCCVILFTATVRFIRDQIQRLSGETSCAGMTPVLVLQVWDAVWPNLWSQTDSERCYITRKAVQFGLHNIHFARSHNVSLLQLRFTHFLQIDIRFFFKCHSILAMCWSLFTFIWFENSANKKCMNLLWVLQSTVLKWLKVRVQLSKNNS